MRSFLLEAKDGLLCKILRGKTVGEQIFQCAGLTRTICVNCVDEKIILAELPHDLAADAAGREGTGDHAILATANGDGGEMTMAVVNCLENRSAFGAVGRTVSGVFNVAARVHSTVSA